MICELRSILKSRRYLIMCIIIIWNTFFIEHLYTYLGGPIGIFGEQDWFYHIAGPVGDFFGQIVKNKNEAYMDFYEYRICMNAVAQLAREFMDDLGAMFFLVSFLIGAFLIQKEKQQKSRKNQMREVLEKYFAAVSCSMILLMLITVIPFVLSFRIKEMGLTGSPFEYFYYLFTWVLPTVMVLMAFHILVGVIAGNAILTMAAHGVIIIAMLPTTDDIKAYPFYKFITRFDGCDERFYLVMHDQIVINKISNCVMAFFFLGLSMMIIWKRDR